ncbi:MAG: nitrous oxide reductase family maturation protein NosD [Candidatus Hermodarchaeota archaeon]
MKIKTKNLAILFVLLLIFPLILSGNLDFRNNYKLNVDNLKTSAMVDFIIIDDLATTNTTFYGNWTWARAQPWCTAGNGTKEYPFIIENITIIYPPAIDCLTIRNSRKHFTVKNCTLKDIPIASFAGIRLENVTNANIVNNKLYNNTFGIYCTNVNNSKIINNNASNNYYGISLTDSHDNVIKGNIADDNFPPVPDSFYGIKLTSSDNNTISENSACNNGQYGISLYNSDGNTISENIAGNNGTTIQLTGIFLSSSNNNNISGNTANNNTQHGIYLYQSDYNNITESTANNNGDSGISLNDGCDQNEIVNNTANNNKWGILLNRMTLDCTNNKIINNKVNDNSDDGIYNKGCDYNNFTGNIVNDNRYYGIFIEGGAFFNNIINNTARRNGVAGISPYNGADHNTLINNIATENTKYGIELYHSDNTKIINNTVNHNGAIGIYIHFANADYNNITGNTINDNVQIGIYLYGEGALDDGCENNAIKNNTINRNNLGIGLKENCNNNTISDNILLDNGMCIFELGCTGNIIDNNTCSESYKELPIFINGSATGVGAQNWTWAESQPWCSGSGTESQPYIIENITRDGFAMTNAMEIINSNVHFIVTNCIFYNSEAGIKLETVSNGTLIENNCSLNFRGIYLGSNCDFNNITRNVVTFNEHTGIVLGNDCDFNILIENTVNNNTNNGIFLQDLCDNNTISHNIALYNGVTGIFLSGGDRDSSYNNTFLANTIDNNEYGIQFEGDCHFNVISGNIIKNNDFGLKFDSYCSNNTVYNNLFLKNGRHAIDDGTDNYWNSTTIGNYWDNWTRPDDESPFGIVDIPYNISGSAGNKDYLPIADDTPPTVIVNSPVDDDLFGTNAPAYNVTITDDYLDEMWYTLDGGLHNYTFTEFTGTIDQSAWDAMSDDTITLTFYASDLGGIIGFADINIEKDTTGPNIVINTPSPGAEFGVTAPSFIITITDDHLDSVWYSLDGGLTTFVITTNDTINQAAWADLSEGSITITFYANDTLGNLSFEDVTITKRIPPAGVDPTIIIIIVVVSVVGGVAVIAGVYIFMKKRATPE